MRRTSSCFLFLPPLRDCLAPTVWRFISYFFPSFVDVIYSFYYAVLFSLFLIFWLLQFFVNCFQPASMRLVSLFSLSLSSFFLSSRLFFILVLRFVLACWLWSRFCQLGVKRNLKVEGLNYASPESSNKSVRNDGNLGVFLNLYCQRQF